MWALLDNEIRSRKQSVSKSVLGLFVFALGINPDFFKIVNGFLMHFPENGKVRNPSSKSRKYHEFPLFLNAFRKKSLFKK